VHYHQAITHQPMKLPLTLLAITLAVLLWSSIRPLDRFTWVAEVLPVLIALPILLFTARSFPLTRLTYILIAIHATILMVGGHYTYAQVPLGFWMQDAFGFARNHYDRIGHLAQGFVPAIVAREVLIRLSVVQRSGWLPFLVLCVCLALSAFYEMIEWWAAAATGAAATAFLGTQGDPWDTQWDMSLAGIGAIVSLVTLSRLHDRQLADVRASRADRPS
jgi:putative membrane protein